MPLARLAGTMAVLMAATMALVVDQPPGLPEAAVVDQLRGPVPSNPEGPRLPGPTAALQVTARILRLLVARLHGLEVARAAALLLGNLETKATVARDTVKATDNKVTEVATTVNKDTVVRALATATMATGTRTIAAMVIAMMVTALRAAMHHRRRRLHPLTCRRHHLRATFPLRLHRHEKLIETDDGTCHTGLEIAVFV